MGINFNDLFNDAGAKVEASLNDLVKVGRPVLTASLEQWGVNVINADLKKNQAETSTVVKELMAKEPDPGSFGAALSATVQGTIFQNYGMQIALGIGALVLLGIVLGRK